MQHIGVVESTVPLHMHDGNVGDRAPRENVAVDAEPRDTGSSLPPDVVSLLEAPLGRLGRCAGGACPPRPPRSNDARRREQIDESQDGGLVFGTGARHKNDDAR